MRRSLFTFFFVLLLVKLVNAQHTLAVELHDRNSGESLPGVIVWYNGNSALSTDLEGRAVFKQVPSGSQLFHFVLIGYDSLALKVTVPLTDSLKPLRVELVPSGKELDEIIVSSVRTNSRLEDINTKVEVLGQEEMDEESTLVPGNITSILGDLSIITIQRTNPLNGNEAIRMQGLDSRYTLIMRDGLPLYEGFSGSLGVLSIPPLDLQQAEIIKGSASTLYGGGAIGGLINFISKRPADSPQTVMTLNVTSLREYNVNAFSSDKKGSTGVTLFVGANFKTATDINGDGFAEVPQQQDLQLHPSFFFDLKKNRELIVGLSTNYNKRSSGDVFAIRNGSDSLHPYLQQDESTRNGVQLNFTAPLSEANTLQVKSAGSLFQRSYQLSSLLLRADQFNSYSEINDIQRWSTHQLISGINLITRSFLPVVADSMQLSRSLYTTTGLFLQDDWQFLPKISLQTGLRYDHHSRYGDFFLPRLSLFYKASSKLVVRLAGGTGYKVPDNFDFSEPSRQLLEVADSIKAEHSYGLNADISYRWHLGGNWNLQIDQAFYYSRIEDPLYMRSNALGAHYLQNGSYYVNSYGTDTYLRLTVEEFELYVGYNHTESRDERDSSYSDVPFNPKDKCSMTLAYDTEKHWRMGIEASWTGTQKVDYNRSVDGFLFMAAMVEYRFNRSSLVLNCENLLDVKQSDREELVFGTRQSPVFASLWGPVEGRVVNLSWKIRF